MGCRARKELHDMKEGKQGVLMIRCICKNLQSETFLLRNNLYNYFFLILGRSFVYMRIHINFNSCSFRILDPIVQRADSALMLSSTTGQQENTNEELRFPTFLRWCERFSLGGFPSTTKPTVSKVNSFCQ